MNGEQPTTPTPATVPAAAGVGSGAVITYLVVSWCNAHGISPEVSLPLAGAVASGLSSAFHKVAQRIHWG